MGWRVDETDKPKNKEIYIQLYIRMSAGCVIMAYLFFFLLIVFISSSSALGFIFIYVTDNLPFSPCRVVEVTESSLCRGP